MVRAKFKVDKVERSLTTRRKLDADGKPVKDDRGAEVYHTVEMQTVVLVPVYSNDPTSENAKFWNASPSGKIELGCVNLEAAQKFELGKEYYIDFSPAVVPV